MGSLNRLLHLNNTRIVLGQEDTLEDIDVLKGGVVTGARNGMLHVSLLPLSPDEQAHRRPILSFPSPVVRVRWRGGGEGGREGGREGGGLPCVLAIATMGTAAGKAAVTVCKLQGGEREGGEEGGGGGGGGMGGRRMLWDLRPPIRSDRFSLKDRDVWGVEWDPWQGRRLLPCLSPGPLIVVDVEARRQLKHSFRLTSDCFAACWSSSNSSSSSSSSGGEEGVFLGWRNGQVRFVDLRASTGMVQPLTTMGCVVDQIEVLPNGRGLLVSDRLGGLRLLDLRFISSSSPPPGGAAASAVRGKTTMRGTTAYLRDFPSTSTTPACTGFVVDLVDSSLVLTLTTQGQLRTFDLNAPQSEKEEEEGGRRARVCVAGILPTPSPYSVTASAGAGAATAAAAAAAPPPRFFLARRWGGGGGGGGGIAKGGREEGSGGGDEGRDVDVWPTLVCGDRTSGQIQQLRLQRERPPSW